MLQKTLKYLFFLFLVELGLSNCSPSKPESSSTTVEKAVEVPQKVEIIEYTYAFVDKNNDIFAEFAIPNVNKMILHNISGGDMTRILINIDVWKDNNIDSIFIANIDTLGNDEIVTISQWAKLAKGKISNVESLPMPDTGYTIKSISLSCEEYELEARKK